LNDVAPHVLLDVSGKGQAAPSRWQRRLPERIVVEDVEAAERLHRASDHGFDAYQRPRIGRDGDRLAARTDDLLHHRFRFHLIEIGHSHLGT
jgi:hypothetical protein